MGMSMVTVFKGACSHPPPNLIGFVSRIILLAFAKNGEFPVECYKASMDAHASGKIFPVFKSF